MTTYEVLSLMVAILSIIVKLIVELINAKK